MQCVLTQVKSRWSHLLKTRNYSELRRLQTFEERYDYLELRGVVGTQTFGFDRFLNQYFYHSREWRWTREQVILRDDGCDLGIPGYDIGRNLLIHHMNPVTKRDIVEHQDWILDPEFLITTTKLTHNAIHYGDRDKLPRPVIARSLGDTQLW